MSVFDRPKTALTIAGVLALVIVLLIALSRLTPAGPSGSGAGVSRADNCAVARRALEAFDQGRPPPAEWIQDRAAAAEAVRNCPQS